MSDSRIVQRLESLNAISGEIVDAAMKVHSTLGPRLLESAYLGCLAHELRTRSLAVEVQKSLPVIYDGLRIEVGYRIDLLVEDAIIVELKVASKLHPVHEAQLLSYLRLSNKRLGLLINFHVTHLKDGIRRIVNNM
jgi:GxxExxY protein